MESDNISISVRPLKEEYDELRAKCCELECHNRKLMDEAQKVGIQYEGVLKEKSDMERQIARLEGQIEAYKYCIDSRR